MRVHFIGIGGIGVSALAQWFLAEGHAVGGSDSASSALTHDLKKRGVSIFIGHAAKNIRGAELVIFSAAISPENVERREAKRRGIPQKSYAEALGELTQKYFTIAVSGTHGKSTTTAMIARIMIRAGLDPMVIIGTKIRAFSAKGGSASGGGSNFRRGRSRYLLIEADEYSRSFLAYHPDIMVWTNIDKEHLDTYGTFRGVVAGFARYLKNLKPGGVAILNTSDAATRDIAKSTATRIVWYALPKKPYTLRVPGAHNQLNAAAAAAATRELGISESTIATALASYRGAWRRLERIALNVFSDYAHHPTEIRATLSALREAYPRKKIITVFQPHQEDRFRRLSGDFKKVLAHAPHLILLPVYSVRGREKGRQNEGALMAERMAEALHARFASTDKELFTLLGLELKKKNTLILVMSAGDLDEKVRRFLVQ